jgi:hypothetical protein
MSRTKGLGTEWRPLGPTDTPLPIRNRLKTLLFREEPSRASCRFSVCDKLAKQKGITNSRAAAASVFWLDV